MQQEVLFTFVRYCKTQKLSSPQRCDTGHPWIKTTKNSKHRLNDVPLVLHIAHHDEKCSQLACVAASKRAWESFLVYDSWVAAL